MFEEAPAAAAPPGRVTVPEPPDTARGVLDVLRGLKDPVFAVLNRSVAASFVDSVRAAGGMVEIISDAVASCVTSLNPESELARQLAGNGWGKGWGVFVSSRQQITVVRNHLRRFQTLVTQDGAEFQFRFFHPALLRGFLPTLEPDEAKALFGPLSAIVVEGNTPDELLLFTAGPGGVTEEKRLLA